MKFVVDQSVFEKIEGVCFAIVSAEGIDNTIEIPKIGEMLQESISMCEEYYEGKSVKESSEISAYRDAFRSMGINPNKYMSSIEALLTRISKKKGMPSINSIVDLGNAVSLKYRVPIGAHDLDSTKEDIFIRETESDDYFIPFGQTEQENPEEGEIVYVTGDSVRTRRWIWRQSEEGKITDKTKSVFFPIDGFQFANREQMEDAQRELGDLLVHYFGCKVKTGWVDKDNREFEI